MSTLDICRRYLADIAFEPRHGGLSALQFQHLDDRLRSDLRGSTEVLRDAHEMHAANHIWVRHTYACWRALQDPGATCICRPWSRK